MAQGDTMTDPIKIDISKFIAKEEIAARAWLGTNWVPYGAGLLSGVLAMAAIHAL